MAWIFDWSPELPTKRELGIGYLAGVGVSLSISLLGYIVFTHESLLVIFISAFIALALFGTIIYLGYLFLDIEIPEEFVWNVAEWTAFGFGIATLVSFIIGFGQDYLPSAAIIPSLLVITIATGGLIGTLLGVITGLRQQHVQMRQITQRNTIMNRVLRHNIRNHMNVILGNADILGEEFTNGDKSLEAITETAHEVSRLSSAAKRIDELATTQERHTIDVTRLVRDCVDTVQEKFPEASITTNLPPAAWIESSPLIRFALINVLENGIEHNDADQPSLTVTVEPESASGRIQIRVADNGPGISEEEREILFADREEPTNHGSGLGLWLVKWFIDQQNGELNFESNTPRGTVVTMDFSQSDAKKENANPSRVREIPA